MTKRFSFEEKKMAAQVLGAADRPLTYMIDLAKPNGAPDYNSASLRARSKETAEVQGVRFSRVARKMATQK